MKARVYSMVPALERLDNFCSAFADVYEGGYPELLSESETSGFERRAWREEWVYGGRLLAVDLTYRSPAQQRDRRLAATAIGGDLVGGNPSAELDVYPYADGQMARHVLYRDAGLVVVNGFPFPEGEVRPLEDEELAALYGSVDTRNVCRSGVMTRALTEAGQERLIADLRSLLAVDGYVQFPQPDEVA